MTKQEIISAIKLQGDYPFLGNDGEFAGHYSGELLLNHYKIAPWLNCPTEKAQEQFANAWHYLP